MKNLFEEKRTFHLKTDNSTLKGGKGRVAIHPEVCTACTGGPHVVRKTNIITCKNCKVMPRCRETIITFSTWGWESIVHVVVNQCFNKLVILWNSRGFFFFFFTPYLKNNKKKVTFFFYISISFSDQCFYFWGAKITSNIVVSSCIIPSALEDPV